MYVRAALAVLITAFCAVITNAQDLTWTEHQLTAQKTSARTQHATAALGDCPATKITLPKTINGSLTTSSCRDFLNTRQDVYAITVAAGETVSIDYKSADYDVFMFMYLGNATSLGTTRVGFRPPVSRVTAMYTFPTAGTFELEVGALWSADSTTQPSTGSYTLSITTSRPSTSTCGTNTEACLLNNRFKVAVNYRNQFSSPPGQTGNFVTARLNPAATNPDTAIFGFGNAQDVEVVVRLVDARPFAPRFDVYYGGLTDVEYWVNVTDTTTGVTRQYHKDPNVVSGGVDRVSFPATN